MAEERKRSRAKVTFRVCEDPECKKQGPHGPFYYGRIPLTRAVSSLAIGDVLVDLFMIGGGHKLIKDDTEAAALKASLREAGLPEGVTEADVMPFLLDPRALVMSRMAGLLL